MAAVGFHGTTSNFEAQLRSGSFDPSLTGSNFPSNELQSGLGLYVVKASSLNDTGAIDIANYFAIVASQNHGGRGRILRVFARNFRTMTRLFQIGGASTLPTGYMIYDYIEGAIINFNQSTQIKFNPHVFPRLRIG